MKTFDLGGVRSSRPFKIRRVSHIGLNAVDLPAMIRCYQEHLGLRPTDTSNGLFERLDPDRVRIPEPDCRNLYFFRYGGDHHQFVLMDKRLWELLDPEHPQLSVNQVSWQVGSLAEVNAAVECLGDENQRILRAGRDMPGSNWHTYVLDPDGYTVELTFGMEQVGWDGYSKPRRAWDDLRHTTFPQLPTATEFAEMAEQRRNGIADHEGFRPDRDDEVYEVGGVMLARPFKIVGMGPFSLIVQDMDRAVDYYVGSLGFDIRSRQTVDGVEFAMLSCNTGHHALALYDIRARSAFGLKADANLVGAGFQVATYRQLREAVAFLTSKGLSEVLVPGELVPGFDHVAHLRDPDGNLIQLYHQMRQCAPADGRAGRASITGPAADWPELIDPADDSFQGEAYMGPWM